MSIAVAVDAFPLVCTALSVSDRSLLCHNALVRRDSLPMVCGYDRCGAEYAVRDGIPVLLSHDNPTPASAYDDDLAAQAYAEMHFASYLPPPASYSEASGDPEGADATALARRLMALPDLTGAFYTKIAEIVLAHCSSRDGLVVDVGCGMARMGVELGAHGWTGRYLGLDLSWRFIAQATRVFLAGDTEVRMPTLVDWNPRSEVVRLDTPTLDPSRSLLAVGDATRMAVPDRSCDVVLGLNLIDRVPNTAQAVRELWRCVAPGGILVLADPFDWMGHPADHRMLSFDPIGAWLDEATSVDLPPDQRSVVFALRRRDARRIVIFEDEVVVYRRAGGE